MASSDPLCVPSSVSIESWQEWLYGRLHAYEKSGRKGLHPTLDFMRRWDERLDHPHHQYPIIHIAGTNGKGSTSALLASILQKGGYRVGLHTSPHLWRFTERMRVNGKEPPDSWVDAFLSRWQGEIEAMGLSFFEATVGMSLAYFAEAQVDIAIVEAGLGGRWDATNIITPLLSVITAIGWDHVEILGPTIAHIAREKGGIIKHGRPVVVAPQSHPEVLPVLKSIAEAASSPFYLSDGYGFSAAGWIEMPETFLRVFREEKTGQIYESELTGDYQVVNLSTVFTVIDVLRGLGWYIPESAIREGIRWVATTASLFGRGQWIRGGGKTILLEVAHNPPGFEALRQFLEKSPVPLEGLILGFSREKDIAGALRALGGWQGPVFFTQAQNPRALSPDRLRDIAAALGYKGESYPTIHSALHAAHSMCQSFLITGSVFLVAEALSAIYTGPQ